MQESFGRAPTVASAGPAGSLVAGDRNVANSIVSATTSSRAKESSLLEQASQAPRRAFCNEEQDPSRLEGRISSWGGPHRSVLNRRPGSAPACAWSVEPPTPPPARRHRHVRVPRRDQEGGRTHLSGRGADTRHCGAPSDRSKGGPAACARVGPAVREPALRCSSGGRSRTRPALRCGRDRHTSGPQPFRPRHRAIRKI